MDSKKYIGMDVHKESTSIAVRNGAGKIVMECVIETKASMILEFINGLRGDLQVTFEEGTWAAWLYDLLKPHVTKLVVCDPRKNASMREGNQSDKIDARRLAELLRLNHLSPVYHGEHGLRSLKELVRSYLTITKDLARVMSRVKAIYRSWAIPCTGTQVYAPRHRAEWLGKISELGVRRRAEFYYQQLDALRALRQQVRRDLLAESKKHPAWKRLCQIPSIGPIRAAVLLGILQTPHRFRTKRQLWTYSGFGSETHSSADHRSVRCSSPTTYAAAHWKGPPASAIRRRCDIHNATAAAFHWRKIRDLVADIRTHRGPLPRQLDLDQCRRCRAEVEAGPANCARN